MAVFDDLKGWNGSNPAYMGGKDAKPQLRGVCRPRPATTEVVQLTFDPTQVSFKEILEVFLTVIHDPTTLNRRATMSGRHTAPAIFHHSAEAR